MKKVGKIVDVHLKHLDAPAFLHIVLVRIQQWLPWSPPPPSPQDIHLYNPVPLSLGRTCG